MQLRVKGLRASKRYRYSDACVSGSRSFVLKIIIIIITFMLITISTMIIMILFVVIIIII